VPVPLSPLQTSQLFITSFDVKSKNNNYISRADKALEYVLNSSIINYPEPPILWRALIAVGRGSVPYGPILFASYPFL
jgi:hypothetical protein